MKHENTILVTWDFTKVSRYALEYAIRINNQIPGRIELMHVVSRFSSEDKIEKIREKVFKALEKEVEGESISLNVNIIKGSIVKSLSQYASETQADLVVMGTHGIKGIQRIFGSRAYKTQYGSKVPFLIVKDKPQHHEKFSKIVLPIDFRTENLEKLESTVYFARYFDSKVYIFKVPAKKKYFKATEQNLAIATKLLDQNNISYEIHIAQRPRWYVRDTIKFAQKIEADLILVMTTQHNFLDFLLGEHEQNIIDNKASIPVLCVNPLGAI